MLSLFDIVCLDPIKSVSVENPVSNLHDLYWNFIFILIKSRQTRRAKRSVLKLCKSSRLAQWSLGISAFCRFENPYANTHLSNEFFFYLSGILNQNAYLALPKVSLGGEPFICRPYTTLTFFRKRFIARIIRKPI